MRKIVLLITLVMLSTWGKAQDFRYNVGFEFFFDNIEASQEYTSTRSLFGVSLTPEIGFSMGKHSLMVGATMIQDLGDSTFLTKADYNIYYNYESKLFSAFAGSFPRKYSIADYPKTFFREDFFFYTPNVKGLMLQYHKENRGYLEANVDWYGMSHKYRIDEFMLYGSTEFNFFDKLMFAGGNILITHYKNDYKLMDSYLLERMLYNVYAGVDFTKYVPFMDEVRLSVGLMSSRDNKRVLDKESSWENSSGGQIDLALRWKGLMLENSFYFGEGQMPHYGQYGGDLFYFGVPFYQSKKYNRTDISWQWNKSFFNFKADFAVHYMGWRVSTQQIVSLGINIFQVLKKGKFVNYPQKINNNRY